MSGEESSEGSEGSEGEGRRGPAGGKVDSRTTGSRGPHRPHVTGGRPHQVRARFSDQEWTTIEAAAAESGVTPTGFVAAAALAQAAGRPGPAETLPARELARRADEMWTQLVRIGTNLNQIAYSLNAGGVEGHRVAAAERWAEQWAEAANDVRSLAREMRRSFR